jgi:2',3'-cyclic-nucleotide 2'-phosphodiesterase (5'-nucleotidase family)
VLTANEGEMLTDGSDPSPGSVSIIDVSAGYATPPVTTVGFGAFDAAASDLKAAGVRLYEDPNNPGQLRLPSLDLEPEYIAVAPNSLSAMVTLQEANAVAILDLATKTFTRIVPLGEKNFSSLLADFSDRDGAGGVTSRNLTTGNPVFGLYMPDAIASYQANGQTYYVTANEGDDRNDFRTETILLGDANYVMDPMVFPDASALKTNARLGRLVVSNSPGLRGDLDNDGEVERILAYGGRSISILDAAGNRIWDSGDMIERLVAELGEPWFDDRRSDNKGPEPEGITIGEVDGRIYAFVALERSRAVMVFEVTDPTRITQAGFVSLPSDLNPESMTFIPASESPSGEPLLAVANETSNTLSFFSVSRFTLQMLHLSNAEAGELTPLLAISVEDRDYPSRSLPLNTQTAPLLAALVEGFEPTYDNTLILAGGDTFAPGPFLTAGSDPALNGLTAIGNTAFARPDIAIHNLIGVEASAVGTHEWALGSRVFANALRPDGAWAGAQFPFLSSNLDYSADEVALERLVEVPINGVTTTVPLAPSLKGKLAPVSVIEKGGEKIGLIGVTNQLLASIASPNGTVVKGTQMNDMDLLASQVQPYINELEAEGVNKIVLLSHLPELALEIALAEKLRGVDVVLAGGSEARLGDADDAAVAFPGHAADFAGDYPQIKSGTDGAPVLIVGTDKQFTYLGRLVVDFDLQGRVELGSLTDYKEEAGAYAASPATVAAVWDIAESEVTNVAFAPGTRAQAVRQITDAVQNVITTKDGNLLGFTRVYLEGADAQVRGQETNLGNLVTDANRALASSAVNSGGLPVVALLDAGNLRTSIGSFSITGGELAKLQPVANPSVGKPAGGISQLDVEAVLRANHKLMVFETNALGLKTLLEHGLALGMNKDRFQQVSGAQFAWDPARPAGDRITSIALLNDDGSSGVPIYKTGALAAPVMALAPPVIRIAVTNALANGVDDFPAKAIGENFRFVLSDRTLGGVLPSASDFTEALQVPVNSATEQDALALFLQARHANVDRAFDRVDTLPSLDRRIQNRLFRADTVPPVLGLDSDGDGLADLDELLLGGNPYAALRVGDLLDLDLSKLLRDGETLRVSGTLPRGVRFDPITGKLSGLIGGSAGLFDVNVILTNAARGVRSVNLRFGLKAFPARLLSGYEALLEGVDGQPKGIVRITATQPSVWTANVDLLGTARRSARGSFALEAGRQRAQVSLVFNATKTTPALRVALVLDADSPLVTGTFDNDALSGNVRGFRLVNFGGSPPDVRRMTVVLDAGAQDGVAYPAGYGWLKGSVNTSGAVNLAGQLGDGQPILVTTRLSATGQALLWSQPYREKAASFIGGVMAMPNVGQPAARVPALTSGSFWFKAANPTEMSYAAGFAGPLPVAALSSGFTTVRTSLELESLLGLTASTLGVEIEGAGLSNAIGNTPVLPSAWILGSNFSLLTSTPGSVPWVGKIAQADGGLTGTLTLPQGSDYLAGKATVTGVLLPAHPGTSTAVGAGLIRVPVAGPKGSFRTSALLIEP